MDTIKEYTFPFFVLSMKFPDINIVKMSNEGFVFLELWYEFLLTLFCIFCKCFYKLILGSIFILSLALILISANLF